MGWLTLLLLGAAAFGAMVALRLPRPLWSMAGAGLMLGATGYALQGRPALPAQAAQPESAKSQSDPGLIALRDQMLGHWTAQGAYVVAADGLTRAGAKREPVQVALAGIRKYPDSVLLWVTLGNTVTAHDGGRVSPPALFAFQQAIRLAPTHAAAPFFLGVAQVRAGDFAAGRQSWARALALTPSGAPWRGELEGRLALLDRYLATSR